MEILSSLGVNATIWVHLACFVVSYLALTNLILKPYMAALREREQRTIGNEETALRLIEETEDLQIEYEKAAREIHAKIKKHYDHVHSLAVKEHDRLLEEARQEAQSILLQARTLISNEIQSAQRVLAAEVPSVGAAIATQLAGKEITV